MYSSTFSTQSGTIARTYLTLEALSFNVQLSFHSVSNAVKFHDLWIRQIRFLTNIDIVIFNQCLRSLIIIDTFEFRALLDDIANNGAHSFETVKFGEGIHN
jgi:hypothetical protein